MMAADERWLLMMMMSDVCTGMCFCFGWRWTLNEDRRMCYFLHSGVSYLGEDFEFQKRSDFFVFLDR
jgi:hypothetical protein